VGGERYLENRVILLREEKRERRKDYQGKRGNFFVLSKNACQGKG